MKKTLLLVLSLIALALPAAADTMEFGYCGPIARSFGAGNPARTNYGGALEIPAITAQQFDGCKITGIQVGFGTAAKYEVEVFISTNLQKDPVYTQKATVKPMAFTTVELDTPYEITGKRVYVGYKFISSKSTDSPMVFDFDESLKSDYGNWVSIALTSSEFNSKWEHYYNNYGNVCVRAVIEGDVSSDATASPVAVDVSPVVRPGKEFTAKVTLINTSTTDIEDVEVAWTTGEESGSYTYTFDTPVAAGMKGEAKVTMKIDEENESLPITFNIAKVNGKENLSSSETIKATVCCSWIYSVRNVLAEKNTGVQCGWCPIAYYAFERMSEEITDGSWIPVAVHNYGSDPVACPSYMPWNNEYVGTGAPKATFNRKAPFGEQPSYEVCLSRYRALRTVTYAEVDLETTIAGAYADVKASVLFSKDMRNIDYGVGFILVEDDLGPYNQLNYYAGGSSGPAGGFENEPSVVALKYNDVAREIFDWNGDDTTIPTEVKAGTAYPVSRSLSLANCKDLSKVKVIAFIVDRKSGEIVNSVRVRLGKSVGVEEIAGNDAPVSVWCEGSALHAEGEFAQAHVYAASGMKVASLLPGEIRTLDRGVYLIKIEGGAAHDKIFKIISRY